MKEDNLICSSEPDRNHLENGGGEVARDYELLMTISMMTLVLSLRNERSKVKVMSHIESVKIG